MTWMRFIAVALAVLIVGIPAFAQDDAAEAPATEGPPADTTPVDGPAEVPTQAPQQPAPTSLPAAPAATAMPAPGTVVFSDNFDDVTRPNFPLNQRSATESKGYIDGQYEMIDGNPNFGVFETVPGTYPNATIALDVRLMGGPPIAAALVACRSEGANAYVFGILPEGIVPGRFPGAPPTFIGPRVRLVRQQPGADATLIDEGPSPPVRGKGEWNHVELTCNGSTISASVNGTEVLSVLDSTYSGGRHRFGLTGNGSTARFDNLTVTLR